MTFCKVLNVKMGCIWCITISGDVCDDDDDDDVHVCVSGDGNR